MDICSVSMHGTRIHIRRLSFKSVSISIRFIIRLRRGSLTVKTSSLRPHNVLLRAVNGLSLSVALSIADADEECPLTLGPINEDNLEFLDGVSFIPELPTFKRLTLPCGHSFGAMSLVYYFARKHMLCPCCRAGFDESIHMESIPVHFRDEIMRNVKTCNIGAEHAPSNSCDFQNNETLAAEFSRYL